MCIRSLYANRLHSCLLVCIEPVDISCVYVCMYVWGSCHFMACKEDTKSTPCLKHSIKNPKA